MMACLIVHNGPNKWSMLGLAALALFLLPSSLYGQRVAWVVGNSDYADGNLPNPVNDARLVSDSLSSLGFEVQLDLNLKTSKEFGDAAREVLSGIDSAEVFLFYYAGHGIQVDNENYLIPTEAEPQDVAAVNRECFAVKEVINLYQRAYRDIPFVAVLDACRVNPFERKWSRSYGSGKGLSKMSAPTGSLIAYSTEYGTTAADGNKDNSDYAVAFAQAIGQPGLSIQEAFQEVRRLVLEASNDVQVPVEQNKLTAQLILRQLPDLSSQQMSSVFDDFEKVLELGFVENALLLSDSLIGVDRKFELVKHYADELDSSQHNLMDRWKHLKLFYLLYKLQFSRGVDDEESLTALQQMFGDEHGDLDPFLAVVAKEFNSLLSIERAQEWISLADLDTMSFSIGELKFAAANQLEDLVLPEINFDHEHVTPYSKLTEAFLQSEFILTFETMVSEVDLANAMGDWDSKSIEELRKYHERLAGSMADPQNRAYSMGLNFLFLSELCLSESTGSGKAKAFQKILKRDWIEMLQPVFEVELEIEEFPEVADAVEVTLIVLNDLLDEQVVSLTSDVNQALAAFYEREFPKVLNSCSGSYFDFYEQGRLLVDHGWICPMSVMPDDEQFALNILDRWDCFVLSYVSDENSNELDVLLDNFLEKCWKEVDSSFEETEISFASWESLSEKHLNLLRLTNKVSTLEFTTSASRFAMVTIDSRNNHQLVAFLQEYWNALSLSNESVFQSFGREYGEYGMAVSNVIILVSEIKDDDLTCTELMQLQSLLESLLAAHFNYFTTEGAPLMYTDIPYLLSALESCSHQLGYWSDCAVVGYDWNTMDSLNNALAKHIQNNPDAQLYFNDQEVVELTIDEFIELEDMAGLLKFFVQRERLFHDGSLNSTHTGEFVELLLSKNKELEELDGEGVFEIEVISLLFQIVQDASEDLMVGRKPASMCEQNIASAIGAIKGFTTKNARDEWNQSLAHSVLVDALQNYFHRTGQRVVGASEILDAAEAALMADKKMGWPEDPELLYVQAEEYSCLSDYQNAIPIWKAMVDDLDYWDVNDRNQFAQNLFLDLLEYEGVSDSHYDQLFRACGQSSIVLDGEWTSSDLAGNVLTLQAEVGDAMPIIEFTNSSGLNTVIIQRPDLQWKMIESKEKLGAITTLRDTTYVPCHGYSYGQIDVSDPSLGEDIVIFSSRTKRESFSEWKIQLPEVLGSVADVSSIRAGFYWGGLPPTSHTQDLKYLTYLKSYIPSKP